MTNNNDNIWSTSHHTIPDHTTPLMLEQSFHIISLKTMYYILSHSSNVCKLIKTM